MVLTASKSSRRLGVVVNYGFLFLSFVLSTGGYWLGWSIAIKIGFWLSIAVVLATFFPIHVGTGLWRLVHTKAAELDEREIQQTLESLRHAYMAFSIISLLIILTLAVLGLGDQTHQLVVFWVLLYLAHTLPSSILAWTVTCVPAQIEE